MCIQSPSPCQAAQHLGCRGAGIVHAFLVPHISLVPDNATLSAQSYSLQHPCFYSGRRQGKVPVLVVRREDLGTERGLVSFPGEAGEQWQRRTTPGTEMHSPPDRVE